MNNIITPNTPQPLWRTEFDKQFTKDMLRDLVKQARALIKRYRSKSTDTAEDRIHTAMRKLFDGSRTWDPTRVDLRGFLLGVVASDLTSEKRRARMAPHVSLDKRKRKREDDYTGEPCDESVAELRASVEGGWPVPLVAESPDDGWYLAMTSLYERAEALGDTEVLELLGAYEEGVFQKRDVMARLKWTSATYKRVYQRLLVLGDAIDPTVREAISYAYAN